MDLVVTLARLTYTSIFSLLDLPINRILEWANIANKVAKRESKNGR